jgi:hypothetical protein
MRGCAIILTLLSLIFSYFLMFSGLTPEGIFYYGFFDRVTIFPVLGFPALVIGLLIWAINIYILQITGGFSHWRDIPRYKKAIPIFVIIVSAITPILIVLYLGMIIMQVDRYVDFL